MSRFGCGKQNRELLLTPVDRLDTMRRWFQSGGEAARPELGVVAVLARRYLGCYERDEYVLAPFYVYISKSKNGWQYLDSLGGAAYTSAKEEYVEHPFLVIQTAMHHAGAHSRNEVDYE